MRRTFQNEILFPIPYRSSLFRTGWLLAFLLRTSLPILLAHFPHMHLITLRRIWALRAGSIFATTSLARPWYSVPWTAIIKSCWTQKRNKMKRKYCGVLSSSTGTDGGYATVFNLECCVHLKACEYNKGLFQMSKYKVKIIDLFSKPTSRGFNFCLALFLSFEGTCFNIFWALNCVSGTILSASCVQTHLLANSKA